MPKVTAPLFGTSARGRIGDLLVFEGRNIVKGWTEQTDPQTSGQMLVRTLVREFMSMIKIAIGLDRAWLRLNFAKSWHTRLVSWLTKNELQQARALHQTWADLTDQERADWESVCPE